jgi:hypothetical protein
MTTKINKILSGCLVGCSTAAALGTLAGCSDFLEIKSQNEIVLEEFWNEKADVDAVVAGCYSRLQGSDIIRRMMIWGEFRSDNVSIGDNIQNDQNLEKVFNENLDASNAYTTWDGFYNVINRCNTVLLYAPQVANIDPAFTQEELRATVAEVSAIRDLCYFYLIRTFRDVPFSTEPFIDDNQQFDLPATKFDQILDFLITDLEKVKDDAIKKYPKTKEYYQRGRITQDAIKAMLCEMYLWQGDYEKCIKYADELIESKKEEAQEDRSSAGFVSAADNLTRLNGFPLVNSMEGNDSYGRAYSSIFGQGNSTESIFELVFMPQDNMLSNAAINDFFGYGPTKGLAAPSPVLLEESTSPYTSKYDARRYENLEMSQKAIYKYVWRSVYITAKDRNTDPNVSYNNDYPRDRNKSNWIIYRLSDIMLMKAEALAELATDENTESDQQRLREAFTLVNAINKRSVCETPLVDTLRANDYRTKQSMQNLVMLERQRELMFEGKRYYDLVRQARRLGSSQTLATTVSPKQSSGGGYVRNKLSKMDAIYWPYNLDEIKVNKNLVQNPAFGSGENSSYEKSK